MRAIRRALRWGRLPFLRRRLPYVLEVAGSPFRVLGFWCREPELALFGLRVSWAVRRASRSGETLLCA